MNGIIIAVIGWGFLFYLNNRTLKKSEISRMKDRVIDRIEKTQEWYIKEYWNSKSDSERTEIEDHFSGKISNIEMRLSQINNYIGRNVFSSDCLVEWRSIDNTAANNTDKKKTIKSIHDVSFQIIDYIESRYDKSNLPIHFSFNNSFLIGSTLGLAICYLFLKIFTILF